MMRSAVLTLILTCSSLSMAGMAGAEDNVAPEGFAALFNGRDLTGWQGGVRIDKVNSSNPDDLGKEQIKANELMKQHWTVQDGVLVSDGKGTNLATQKYFKNFELLVDWKIKPKGDSGIYLRGIPQVQIWDSKTLKEPRFALEKNKGSGALWNNKKPEDKVPLVFADNEPGQWNTFHVTMVGEKVSVKLNGKLVVDQVTLENIWQPSQPLPERGPIELQFHPNQDGVADNLYFKNVYIKELP